MRSSAPATPEGAPIPIVPRADDMPAAEAIWPFPVPWSEVESILARVSALARAAALQTSGSP
jgi:hypothetical protein